jgi:hypothetical protein
MQSDLDLSDAYNRIADSWYPIYAAGTQLAMPVAACAYPINMGEHMIASIRDDMQPEDWYLRWQMSMAGADYHLYCNWQGRGWQHDEDCYLFIDNAVGWVDWIGRIGADVEIGRLDVHVAFGRPSFESNIGAMTVDFLVTETDPDGSVRREVHRPFQIWADGRRTPLF